MNIVSKIQHNIKTKFHAVTTYRNNKCSVQHICDKYHISKASLMRWNKKFDGTKESLANESRKPKSPHPNQHTDFEISKITNLIKRNPNIGMTELYTKLRVQISYSRHYSSLYRVLVRLGYFANRQSIKKKYTPKKYATPEYLGEKMQLDVKFIPKDCNANLGDDFKYYQYTIIDEASRERFIYPFKEHSSASTCEFVIRAILYFGYIPKEIQTDNGFEFTHFKQTNMIHPFDKLCDELGIKHKLIKPRTPRHNGKVERSHRNDNERFYNTLKFYDYDDLLKQMKSYLYRSNRIGMTPLNYKTLVEMRKKLIDSSMINYISINSSIKQKALIL